MSRDDPGHVPATTGEPAPLIDRLERLERRLEAIERRLGVLTPVDAELPGRSVAVEAELPAASVDRRAAGVSAVPPPLPVHLPTAGLAPPPLPVRPPSEPSSASAAPEPALPYAPPTARPPVGVAQGSLEQTIGLKWAGWVGAVILVIAVGLGIKYGYDQGWFGGVPATVRLVLCWMGSFGLIAAGEWVYRRVNKLSAVGLFGAGVASLFVVSYAGHGYFDVYTRGTAFALMAASTVAGMLVAMRGRLVSVAVLSLIGGNLAPVLLGGDEPNLGAFLAYVGTLQVTALALSLWGGTGRWWTLRGLSLATTAFWTTLALAGIAREAGIDPRGWPVAVVVLFAALYQLELILSAWLRRDAGAGGRTGATFSLLVTAVLAGGLAWIYHASGEATRGGVVALLAAVCAGAGFGCRALGGVRDGLGVAGTAGSGGGRLHALAVSFAVQSAVLLVAAVPLAFSGWAVLSGWTALALGFAGIGAALDLRVPRRAGVVTWALAAGYFAWWVHGHWGVGWTTLFTVASTPVPEFLGVAMLLSAAGHAVAAIILSRHASEPDRREFSGWATVAQVLAGVLWVGASVAALPPVGATLSVLVYAWLCGAVDRLAPRRLNLAWHAAGAVAVAGVKWAVVDVVAHRLSPDWSAASAQVLANPTMAVGAAIAVTLLVLWWARRDRWVGAGRGATEGAGLTALVVAVIVMLTVGLSVEVDRAVTQLSDRSTGRPPMPWAQVRMLCWTMLWSASVGAVAGAVRLIRGESGVRAAGGILAGLGLLLAVKFVAVDTLGFRLLGAPAAVPVGGNLQVVAGAVVTALLGVGFWVSGRAQQGRPAAGWAPLMGLVVAVLPLWVVSLEIDRWGGRQGLAAPWVARNAGWSVFWSVYAIGMVVAGFAWRTRGLRYFGLGLFALTLVKVVVVDLSGASTGLRILSFFGLGVLLLATSVVYGKVSPRLLSEGASGGVPPSGGGGGS